MESWEPAVNLKIKEVGMIRQLTLAMATVVMILALTEASEAGGLFLTEFGTEDVALAGAGWAARAQDASTLFKNPAWMSLLEGNQFQGGLEAFYFQSGGFNGTNTPWGWNGGENPVGVLLAASGFYVHSLGKDFKVGLGMFRADYLGGRPQPADCYKYGRSHQHAKMGRWPVRRCADDAGALGSYAASLVLRRE